MIPFVVPPLTGLSVLITRPAAQAGALAAMIEQRGGMPVLFPAIEVVPIEAAAATGHELAIFISVNAVAHGARCITRQAGTRIAAIGNATAAALAAAGLEVDLVPDSGFNSEALLAHPELNLEPGSRVLIVRGAGGRELLQETFAARGCVVETLDVYTRALPVVDAARRDELETAWADGGVDVVTATSAATLHNLHALLSDRGRGLLRITPLVMASRRIEEAALELGLQGARIVAAGADDAALAGALTYWHARARGG